MIDTIDLSINLDKEYCQGQTRTVTKCQGHSWQVYDRERREEEGEKKEPEDEKRQTDVEN